MRAAIIGAGIAGLNLARRLAQSGVEVQLFEKARGPSGRMSTRRAEVGQFDHGAQYLTARDPRFRAQVDDWLARDIVAPWTGRIVRLPGSAALREEPAIAEPRERFVGQPRMSALARDMLGELPVELGVRIESADRENERWTLRSEQGDVYSGFDILLLAVPAPQALPFLDRVPTTRSKVEGVAMLPCHAVMVRFEKALVVAFEGAFVDGPELSWVALDSSKPGRGSDPCWLLHSQAAWSAANVDLESTGVIRELLAGFERALGRSLPELAFSSAHRWLYARTGGALSDRAIWHPEQGLGLCGDWLQGDRVEDAYLSGETLAEQIGSAAASG